MFHNGRFLRCADAFKNIEGAHTERKVFSRRDFPKLAYISVFPKKHHAPAVFLKAPAPLVHYNSEIWQITL